MYDKYVKKNIKIVKLNFSIKFLFKTTQCLAHFSLVRVSNYAVVKYSLV